MTAQRNRPSSAAEAAPKVNPTTETIVPPLSARDLMTLADRRQFAVRVVSRRVDGIVVSQVFADLRAAERKHDRQLARGLDVRLELVRLVPVMPLEGGWPE
ncbi:hypothetical protein [Janibacter sp. G1551]|uniref:hypothetical protein n=1 Tax=Janibacter sp. G1551 TaxID=3420440 RepID=UPI003D05438D